MLLAAGLGAGGGSYLGGFERTTLARAPGSATPLAVLGQSWSWAGLVLVLAISGVVISCVSRPGAAQAWLLGFLSAALVAGPLEQAHLHTAAALNHHVGLGAWFAAIAAGYAVDRFIEVSPLGPGRAVTCGACVIALVFPAALGVTQSRSFSSSWPNATSFISIFTPLADHDAGPLLVEDPSVAEYYAAAGAQWQRWSSTRNITRPAASAPVARPPPPASPVPGTRPSTPATSPTATSPWSP